MTDELTHLDEKGQAHMVDVSGKDHTQRLARASGLVKMSQDTLKAIKQGDIKKGDVLATARIAGIMAAKKTPELIPLCHPLAISKVTIDIELDEALPGLIISAQVKTTGQTGVEMEALTACSVACLTIYDMAKAMDKGMEIGPITLEEKQGGKSGAWQRGAS